MAVSSQQKAPRRWRWWFAFVLFAPLLLCLVILIADKRYPLPEHYTAPLVESVRVVDRDHQPLRYFLTPKGYWRIAANQDDISPIFLDMLIRFEDKRFYEHHGVDFLALFRAVGQRLMAGRTLSGASTITMQLARLSEPKPRTIPNKIVEMFRAWQLENVLSKREILERYLTLASYGGNLQGIEAASEFYFGMPSRELTVSQAALLVSLPQNPERLRPDRFLERARARRDVNLQRLYEQGVLDDEALRLAKLSPVPSQRIETPKMAMHESMALLQAQQRRQAKQERASQQSLIRTTLSRDLQRKIERLAQRVQYDLPSGSTISIAVADRRTMALRAYVGTGYFFAEKFAGQVDMLRAVRSPGSTLKPAIYAMAFNDGWLHPQTRIRDARVSYDSYLPENFDAKFIGEMSVSEALIASRNTPAIKVLQRLRPQAFAERLQSQGIQLHFPKGQSVATASLPIAVGGTGITMQDLLELYGCLANQGLCQPLRERNDARELPPSQRWLSPQSAWAVSDILRQMPKPMSTEAELSTDVQRSKIAYKTGTSYGYRDAWSVGYDDDWVAVVWIGRPDGDYQPYIMGLQDAAPVLMRVFSTLTAAKTTVEFKSDIAALPSNDIPESPFALSVNARGMLTNTLPPPALENFDESVVAAADLPEILFPVEESRVLLAGSDAPAARQSVRLQYTATHFPVTVWLDDEQIAEMADATAAAAGLPVLIAQKGAHALALVDAKGQSDRVQFWVDKHSP